ncbi:MAG: class I SAM-dependent methyltransferase [Erysipelotrichaceae bacterium]|nr:class I SAM-dependent methyltransferase [Erysipelotrichaceae bacterium]
MNQIANQWKDYEILDTGNKEKLERWKSITLRRPDPVCIWPIESPALWDPVDAHYHRSKSGGGHWDFHTEIKEFWTIDYKDLTFKISPTGFKHTGLFPEQAANWDFMMEAIRSSQRKDIRVLNLFAYIGAATMACSKAGAMEVVHVDAAKGMIQWAKDNMKLNHLENQTIRFLVDDCLKFVKREQRRNRKYDAIIMDPPSYGRGPKQELWKLEDNLFELVQESQKLLSDDPLFFLINCYTTGFSCATLQETLTRVFKERNGIIETGENLLPVTHAHSLLPCGIYGKWIHESTKR